jgi:16S rRNA (guanine966-N2)-methyltransferase
MRIISGKYRGRRLKTPRGNDLRPTGNRLKETLFDILGQSIDGAMFLDVFAGTGAIGLEAISRGADEVLFIESNPEAVRLIRSNLALCGVKGGYRLLDREAFASLRSLGRSGFSADITFMDPPYDWEPYRDLLDIVFRIGITGGGSQAILEHHSKSAVPDSGPQYRLSRRVRQSDKCLSFYVATPPSSPR